MLKIGTVILCMTLIGNCCESKTSEALILAAENAARKNL